MQDLARLKLLIDAASKIAGGDMRLAELMKRPKQHISNWRHGHKTPSVEVQADLAAIAGWEVPIQVMRALIEDAEGDRKTRLNNALSRWVKEEMGHGEAPKMTLKKAGAEGITRLVGNL